MESFCIDFSTFWVITVVIFIGIPVIVALTPTKKDDELLQSFKNYLARTQDEVAKEILSQAHKLKD